MIQDAIKQGNGMSNAGTYRGHAETILIAIGEEFDEMQWPNGQSVAKSMKNTQFFCIDI
jgi:hypothetical protein